MGYHQEEGVGKKYTNQDTVNIFEVNESGWNIKYYAVYDGHGEYGREVSF